MKKTGITFAAAALLLAAVPGVLVLRGDPPEAAPAVAATTNVLSSLAREISGGAVRTLTLIPPGNCPGYFDMKVSTLRAVGDSGVLLAHGFEEYLPAVVKALPGKEIRVFEFPSEGSWLTPGVQIALGERVAEVLSEVFPEKRRLFDENLRVFKEETEAAAGRMKSAARAHGLEGMRALCNEHLAGYLEHLGMVPAGSYGRKEDLTASRISALIETGSREKAVMVIDNLQAGPDTGRAIAEDLGAAHAVISNFPDGFPDTPSLSKTMERNLAAIIKALDNHHARN